jgi:putative ABC transport system permease protein
MGLNLLGLAAAFVAFLLLMMQWNYDREFDRHDPNAEYIYRIDMGGGDRGKLAVICRPLAEMLMQSSPHIQAGCLLNSWEFEPVLTVEQNGVRNTFKESMMSVSNCR